jgi:signal transduction histidine kinase
MRDRYVHITSLFFTYCLWVLSISPLSAQTPQPALRHYTADDGLPSSECYEIIQDRQGYIWISTDNGISRFDGYTFKNFGTAEGLLDKTVLVMKEDHQGWIWMSTFSGNFYIYRGDTIAAYAHNEVLQEIRSKYYLVNNFVVRGNGSLTVALQGFNLMTITESGASYFHDSPYAAQNGARLLWHEDPFPSFFVDRFMSISKEAYLVDREKYWDKNILHVNLLTKDNQAYAYEFPANHTDQPPSQDRGSQSNGWDTQDGYILQHFDLLYLVPVLGEPAFQTGKSAGYINCLLSLPDGSYYVGYNKLGYNQFGGVKYFKDIASLLLDSPGVHFLKDHTVSHILKDNSGGLWMATTDDGVFYAPAPAVLLVHSNEMGKKNNLRRIENYRQNFLLGDASGGIYQLDQTLGLSKHSQVNDLTTMDDFFASDGVFGVSSPLQILNKGYWQNFSYYDEAHVQHKGLSIKKMRPSISPNSFWAIRTFRGLFKFKWENKQLVIQEEYALFDNNKLTALAEEADTYPWVGSLNGLFQLDQNRSLLIPVVGDPIFQERVEDICLLPGGGIAVGTRGSGLYTLQNNCLTVWTEQQGLSSNTISQLKVVDNILWAASNKGLNRIPLDQGISGNYVYTQKDGLPDENIVDMAFNHTDVMLLTKHAVTKLNQTLAAPSPETPLYIEEVSLNGVPIKKTALSQLRWRENNLQLRYQLLDYAQDGGINYRFRLAPAAPWVYTENNTLDLLNLSPTDYLLEIQAKDRTGRWIAAEPLPINIRPPFWQRLWFASLCLFLAFLVGYHFFRRRLKDLAIQQERLGLEEQINQLKQQAYRAQMNPHFIFNTLNAIQGLILGEQLEKEKAVGYLSKFSRLIRTALDASAQEKITLKQEVELLHNYLALEQMRFDHSFSYHITLADDLETEWVQIPPLLIQPYVENAVLHGMEAKQGDGVISIELTAENELLRVCIRDNGPGIYTQQAKKEGQNHALKRTSYGMNITRQRLDVSTAPHNKLQINELKNPAGMPIGTEIILLIPLSYAN